MPDWQKLVRERLSRLQLDTADKQEVCAELAGHLEEDYQYSLAAGASEQQAIRRALCHVNDWHDLQSKIESSRNEDTIMNKRVTQFWFPAFVTLVLSLSLLILIEHVEWHPSFPPNPNPWRAVAPAATVYLSWLLTLTFVGSFGAYLCLRSGGSLPAVFSSIAFPVLPYLATFVVGVPVALEVGQNFLRQAFLVGLVAWVILPMMALSAGGLATWLCRFTGRSHA